ncbi:MAG: AAA family ATPase [bacterium]
MVLVDALEESWPSCLLSGSTELLASKESPGTSGPRIWHLALPARAAREPGPTTSPASALSHCSASARCSARTSSSISRGWTQRGDRCSTRNSRARCCRSNSSCHGSRASIRPGSGGDAASAMLERPSLHLPGRRTRAQAAATLLCAGLSGDDRVDRRSHRACLPPWDAKAPVACEDIHALVLIDELDLHLHPRWQSGFVTALKRVFPNVQFIATTHSPMVLPGSKPMRWCGWCSTTRAASSHSIRASRRRR